MDKCYRVIASNIMKTPFGIECNYFYGDYHRGMNHEECRLLGSAWARELCRNCPAPSINRANACESMTLRGEIRRPILAAFQRRVTINTFCEKNGRSGFDPHIGCGECHPVPPIFEVKK